MLQNAIVWSVMLCRLAKTFRLIRDTCCLIIAVESSTLMKETVGFSETCLNFHQITRWYNPDNKSLLSHAETQTHTRASSCTTSRPYVSTGSDTTAFCHTFHLFFKFVTSHLPWQFKIIRFRHPEETQFWGKNSRLREMHLGQDDGKRCR